MLKHTKWSLLCDTIWIRYGLSGPVEILCAMTMCVQVIKSLKLISVANLIDTHMHTHKKSI